MDNQTLSIYTDGSSRDNGKPHCVGGWAMCVPNFHGKTFVRYGHLPAQSSNNKGEIMGVLYAMHLLNSYGKPINITSDSQYVVKSCNEWRWKWAKSKYAGIANKELLVPLFNYIDKHGKVNLQWVRGHNGDPGNEFADEYAGLGMRNIVRDKIDATTDIRFVPFTTLPKEWFV